MAAKKGGSKKAGAKKAGARKAAAAAPQVLPKLTMEMPLDEAKIAAILPTVTARAFGRVYTS